MSIKLNTAALKKMLAVNGLTNAALAEKAGISRQNLSTILRRGTCSAITVGRLADALGVDIEAIWKED